MAGGILWPILAGRRARAGVPTTQSGRGFRFEAGHHSDLIPATIPK
jgi:hypothetical protein